MKKRIVLIFISTLLVALFWYLFLMEGDVRASFKLNALPGTINQLAKDWHKGTSDDNFEQWNINEFSHTITEAGNMYSFQWNVVALSDSSSKIIVTVTQPGSSIKNRLARPFYETDIERTASEKLKGFYKEAQEHLGKIRVEVVGREKLDSVFCVYVPVSTTQRGKAPGMIQEYPLLSNFIMSEQLKAVGPPMLEVVNWDMKNDSLNFNFCWPIQFADSLPVRRYNELRFKWISGFNGLKATYFGNYKYSDRAWYALQYYAKENGIDIVDRPVEVFLNNPNIEGNERHWQADIYIPVAP